MKQGRHLALADFYRKRAFRILPAYAVVLALYFLWPRWRDGNGLSPLWQLLTFTMNLLIDYPAKNSFSHAWSLCVEEHFYLLLPFAVLLLSRRASIQKTTAVVIGILVGGVVLRAWFVLHVLSPLAPLHGERSGPFIISYMEHIYYPTWSRLNGLLAGVVIALLELYRPEAWQQISRYRNALLFWGAGTTAFALYAFRDRFTSNTDLTAFSSVFGYPILSIGLGMLVMSAAMKESWLAEARIFGTRALALLSYSLYLTHKPVANVLYSLHSQWMDKHQGWATAIILPAALAAAFLLYLGVERPFLALRGWQARPQAADEETLLNPGI